MRTIKGINYFADDIDADVIDQMETAVFSVDGAIGSLMADAHLGYRMPIGGVIAYPDKISPSGVGYDIGCGNYAVRLHENVNFTKEMGDEINRIISFGIGGSSRIEHSRDQKAFIEEWDWDLPLLNGLKDIAMNQYATVGGGNHYVDLMEDTEGNSWIAVHFGSRGFGWQICKRSLDILGMKDSMMGTPALINKGTALYNDYFYAHNCALKFVANKNEL
jgi:tRNA-splicing ligase RtcB